MHRLYWNVKAPKNRLSAFLSYPHGMALCLEYFWELYLDDVERWTGPNAETEMEARILAEIGDAAGSLGETLDEWTKEGNA